ncbi:unnamed protein product [Lymnaea stagnalis]|uniref:Uncharacterized protein n=1 Tax=Lymnaea stagnalis TaxID=6523 RepID=A0AAV2IFD0_LYMST
MATIERHYTLIGRGNNKGGQVPTSPARKRDDQGDHECEELDEGTGPSERWEACLKNPGHKDFIAAQDLSIEDLPPEYRDTGVFELVRLLSDLTVKVCVEYTSTSRPDGYIFSKFRGQTVAHTGTGFVVQCEFHV